jgi:murein tripeptide amidase MpaA
MIKEYVMLAFLFLAGIGVVSNFEGGSVGKVDRVGPDHLQCAVRGQADQDQRNRQANWYYFELTHLPRRAVTIDLTNLAGEYNYHSPAFAVTKDTRPVYSYDGVTWTHFSNEQVSWQESYLRLRFEPASDHIWIAHVAPYTNRDLERLLNSFQASPYFDRQVVGHTVQKRDMLLLTITNPKASQTGKKVIWLMFRQHAWETGSSWVCEGAIRFLLSDDERAQRLRDGNIVKIFPMADPDGVADGGVRFNQNGYDLNRNWDTIDPRTMPEIAAQHKAILDWVDAGHPIDLFLSLHNTETGEYLEAPAPFHALGERLFQNLTATTSFNPTVPLRDAGETTTPGKAGRMQVDQGLFHDRKLPAMLMEQMVDFNSKLGRYPQVSDRVEFGAGLVRAIAAAVD